MWIPRDAEEVEAAVAAGRLEETHTFDGKKLTSKNKDIAIDVCAMTPDGGSLLYGVAEDSNRRLTVLAPFELAGQRERVDQIVATSIVEVPTLVIHELPLARDASSGYLAIGVPQSPRAPHQVAVGGDMRYYGRGATTNRILTEREVGDLYARRQRWEVDRNAQLDAVVAAAPLDDATDWAYMHAIARPVTFDSGFLRREIEANAGELFGELVRAVNVVSERLQYQPDLRLLGDWRLHGAEGIEIASAIADRRKAIRMTISHEGEARLFACAGARYGPGRALAIFEKGAAGNLTSFLSAAGAFYSRAGYVGQLDTGVALTGVRGGVAHHEYQRASGFPFPADDFRSTGRFVALELVERPRDVAMQLLRRFLDAIVAFGYEPGV